MLSARALVLSEDGVDEVTFGSASPDALTFDLLAALSGSEGMLAVVTEILVKLTPKPEIAQVVMASFDSVVTAADAVAAIIAAGIIPAGLEMMDKQAIAAVEPHRPRWLPDTDAGSHPAMRIRRHIGRSRTRNHTNYGSAGETLAYGCYARRTGGTKRNEALGRTQAQPSRSRAHHAGLPLYGWDDSQKTPGEMNSQLSPKWKRNTACGAPTYFMRRRQSPPLIMFDANDPDETGHGRSLRRVILELCIDWAARLPVNMALA